MEYLARLRVRVAGPEGRHRAVVAGLEAVPADREAAVVRPLRKRRDLAAVSADREAGGVSTEKTLPEVWGKAAAQP